MFLYSNTGSAAVLKSVDGGGLVTLHPWTPNGAIVAGGYNTIRVVATGSNLSYTINGAPVWSGSDTSLANGQVGVVMYRDGYSTSNWFDVDYATLTGGTAALAQQQDIVEHPGLSLGAYPADASSLYMSPGR